MNKMCSEKIEGCTQILLLERQKQRFVQDTYIPFTKFLKVKVKYM